MLVNTGPDKRLYTNIKRPEASLPKCWHYRAKSFMPWVKNRSERAGMDFNGSVYIPAETAEEDI